MADVIILGILIVTIVLVIRYRIRIGRESGCGCGCNGGCTTCKDKKNGGVREGEENEKK